MHRPWADLISCGILEFGIDTAGGNRHGDGLGCTDLLVRDVVFLSIAKAVGHSRVASHGHGHGQVDEPCGFRV